MRKDRVTRPRILEGRGDRHRLTDTWCRTLGIGWTGIAIALAGVGASSQMIGRPVWWADDERWNLAVVTTLVIGVFLAITFVCVWSFFRGPYIPQISAGAAVLLGLSSFVDRDSSPGGAVVTAVIAVSGLLLAVAGFSGRSTPRQDDNRADVSSRTES